jgi:ribosomal protein L37AE/L43A
MICEMCDNNGTRREDNIYLCDECNETYPIKIEESKVGAGFMTKEYKRQEDE